MKKLLLSMLAISALAVTSCSSDDDSNNNNNNGNVIEGTVITGTITEDLFVPKGDYTLRGTVLVEDGATLTIEKGSTITVTSADESTGINVLMVKQGGKLVAEGTAQEPIIFTSEGQGAGEGGDWGGIVLHGRATINGTDTNPLSEAGQLPYSGTNDADSSGSLKYVRVEYAGVPSSDGQFEYNAFSFFACGSGTIVQNCEAYKGADDGFEFYGGTVSATNLIAIDMEDDSIDWDQGYRGTLTNIAVYQSNNIGDFAFELSSRKTEWNLEPRSNPTVKNVTIRGNMKAGKSAFDLKEGTAGDFDNVKVYNVEYVAFVNNQVTQVEDGSLKMTNANLVASIGLVKNNVPDNTTDLTDMLFVQNSNAVGANLSAFDTWSHNSELTW
ncbi:hypothetical protein E0W68_02425 [Flavobacterium salilacus subsp. salilacus]|uniref:hypothetical protein n=1 Tax=Flavobacterium TaxID=237 RepID=UPI001075737C|nr:MULTISPECIES: hypothetical protein [Flavobacterium]KAF2520097.1 hypothetical protein E0W68_02425 [Flavobacterium salilacus subsp. salilacus]MBE1613987.1 hypothetical protein [Flavobacterium sp. SaA2.13]